MSKLTPEQAWPHLKALFERAAFMRPYHHKVLMTDEDGSERVVDLDLDWPEDMTRHPKWRKPVWPNDHGKLARFRSHDNHQWAVGTLCGMIPGSKYPWWAPEIGQFSECEVEA